MKSEGKGVTSASKGSLCSATDQCWVLWKLLDKNTWTPMNYAILLFAIIGIFEQVRAKMTRHIFPNFQLTKKIFQNLLMCYCALLRMRGQLFLHTHLHVRHFFGGRSPMNKLEKINKNGLESFSLSLVHLCSLVSPRHFSLNYMCK